jgi:hypothetical protein
MLQMPGKQQHLDGFCQCHRCCLRPHVEFLVELLGNKQQFGIDTLLAFQATSCV